RTPTTTGKIERWHKTLREEFLSDHASFADLADARARLDSWVEDYNHHRPHQSLDMATPASRFIIRQLAGDSLPLRRPPSLAPLRAAAPCPVPATPPALPVLAGGQDAVEIDRIVPASGNLFAAGRQIWLGTALAGQQVTLRLDPTTLHVFCDGQLLK